MTEGGGGSGGRRRGGGGGRGGDGEGSPPAAPAVLASKEHGSGHADPQDRKAHGPPFGSPGWMGEMAPAGWMRAHPYPLPPFSSPSSLHLCHTKITCQAFTMKSSGTAAAWNSATATGAHRRHSSCWSGVQQSKHLSSHGYTCSAITSQDTCRAVCPEANGKICMHTVSARHAPW